MGTAEAPCSAAGVLGPRVARYRPHLARGQEGRGPLRFEIMRLNETDGTATDRLIVDAESVREMVEKASATGERLYIRPAEPAAAV